MHFNLKLVLTALLVFAFFQSWTLAAPDPEQISKVRTLLEEISRQASILEGENAAMAKIVHDEPSKSNHSRSPVFEDGLSESVQAERAISHEFYHRRKRDLLAKLGELTTGHSPASEAVIQVDGRLEPVGNIISRYRRRALIWNTLRTLCEQMIFYFESEREAFSGSDSTLASFSYLLKQQLWVALFQAYHLDLEAAIIKLKDLSSYEGGAPKERIEGPSFPTLHVKKIRTFLMLSSKPPEESSQKVSISFETLNQVFGNPKMMLSFSTRDAFEHPSLSTIWQNISTLFEIYKDSLVILDPIIEAEPQLLPMKHSDFITPIYQLEKRKFDLLRAKCRRTPFFEMDHFQPWIDRLSLKEMLSLDTVQTLKERLHREIRSNLSDVLTFSPSKKPQPTLPNSGKSDSLDGLNGASTSLLTTDDATHELKGISSLDIDDASSESYDPLPGLGAGSDFNPEADHLPATETADSKKIEMPDLTEVHKKLTLKGRAAQLFYATGLTARIKGYRIPSFTNDDFSELLKQLGTADSLKGTGHGSAFSFVFPDFSGASQLHRTGRTRAFRIHLAHSGRDEFQLQTIRRYLASALETAGLTEKVIDLQLP